MLEKLEELADLVTHSAAIKRTPQGDNFTTILLPTTKLILIFKCQQHIKDRTETYCKLNLLSITNKSLHFKTNSIVN